MRLVSTCIGIADFEAVNHLSRLAPTARNDRPIRDHHMSVPHGNSPSREHNLAVFIDLENLAQGYVNQKKTRFEILKVLERLLEKGKLIVKKAYADWNRYQAYTGPFHEAAIELIEIPRRSQTGKNSADIRLVVDAMDLAWSKPHIDTFVIVSGDSDFSPLVSKLKENGRHVIGMGMKGSTSELLRDNCDEFIYYEDLERIEEDEQKMTADIQADLPERKREAFSLLIEACNALVRENNEVLYASLIKDTMKRKKPSFDESYYGYRNFNNLLEDADNKALIDIEVSPRSGTYVITRFGNREQKPKQKKPAVLPAIGGPAMPPVTSAPAPHAAPPAAQQSSSPQQPARRLPRSGGDS
jgi:uncharacterized protein (TIGR00288 family)